MPVLLQATRTDPRGTPVLTGQRPGGSVTVVHRQGRKGKGAGPSQLQDTQLKVERAVVNCLKCGKVFNPLVDTPDARFLVGESATVPVSMASVASSLATSLGSVSAQAQWCQVGIHSMSLCMYSHCCAYLPCRRCTSCLWRTQTHDSVQIA